MRASRKRTPKRGPHINAPNHSPFMRKIFPELKNSNRGGVDLKRKKVEIKETRSGFYTLRPKDKRRSKQFLFYNHKEKDFSLVDSKDIKINNNRSIYSIIIFRIIKLNPSLGYIHPIISHACLSEIITPGISIEICSFCGIIQKKL